MHTKRLALNSARGSNFLQSRLLCFIRRVTAMEIDGPSSSPPAMYSELPPSSAPDPTPRANGSTPRRPIADALTMSIDLDKEASKTEGTGGRRKKPRQVNGDVPMVKDAVGEGVAESFETFLKTSVGLKFQMMIHIESSSDLPKRLHWLQLLVPMVLQQTQQKENSSTLNKSIPCANMN